MERMTSLEMTNIPLETRNTLSGNYSEPAKKAVNEHEQQKYHAKKPHRYKKQSPQLADGHRNNNNRPYHFNNNNQASRYGNRVGSTSEVNNHNNNNNYNNYNNYKQRGHSHFAPPNNNNNMNNYNNPQRQQRAQSHYVHNNNNNNYNNNQYNGSTVQPYNANGNNNYNANASYPNPNANRPRSASNHSSNHSRSNRRPRSHSNHSAHNNNGNNNGYNPNNPNNNAYPNQQPQWDPQARSHSHEASRSNHSGRNQNNNSQAYYNPNPNPNNREQSRSNHMNNNRYAQQYPMHHNAPRFNNGGRARTHSDGAQQPPSPNIYADPRANRNEASRSDRSNPYINPAQKRKPLPAPQQSNAYGPPPGLQNLNNNAPDNFNVSLPQNIYHPKTPKRKYSHHADPPSDSSLDSHDTHTDSDDIGSPYSGTHDSANNGRFVPPPKQFQPPPAMPSHKMHGGNHGGHSMSHKNKKATGHVQVFSAINENEVKIKNIRARTVSFDEQKNVFQEPTKQGHRMSNHDYGNLAKPKLKMRIQKPNKKGADDDSDSDDNLRKSQWDARRSSVMAADIPEANYKKDELDDRRKSVWDESSSSGTEDNNNNNNNNNNGYGGGQKLRRLTVDYHDAQNDNVSSYVPNLGYNAGN